MYLTLFPVSKRASCRERTLLGIWRYIHRAHTLQGIFSSSATKRSGNSVPNPTESTPSWLRGPHWRLGRVQKLASPRSQHRSIEAWFTTTTSLISWLESTLRRQSQLGHGSYLSTFQRASFSNESLYVKNSKNIPSLGGGSCGPT